MNVGVHSRNSIHGLNIRECAHVEILAMCIQPSTQENSFDLDIVGRVLYRRFDVVQKTYT